MIGNRIEATHLEGGFDLVGIPRCDAPAEAVPDGATVRHTFGASHGALRHPARIRIRIGTSTTTTASASTTAPATSASTAPACAARRRDVAAANLHAAPVPDVHVDLFAVVGA